MGILNLTPDSFFEGSRVPIDKKSVLEEAEKKIKEGADFLDLDENQRQEHKERLVAQVRIISLGAHAMTEYQDQLKGRGTNARQE